MTTLLCELLVTMLAGMAASAGAPAIANDQQLVLNPEFRSVGDNGLPEHWTVWKPAWQKAECALRTTPEGLLVDAPQQPYAVGGVHQAVRGIAAGQAYGVESLCQVKQVSSPLQSVLVRVTWTEGGKLLHPAGMLVRGPRPDGTLAKFEDILVAPDKADGAQVSLEVKWPQGGSVLWKRVSMCRVPPPPPRQVKIGTVYLRPKKSTSEKNLELFCQQIDAAGQLGLDILCLPESITQVGTPRTLADCAEPIPGPATQRLGAAAGKNHLWVVAGLTERQDDRIYNTAVLLDRAGHLAGKYRKVHLPREEWKIGVTPGDDYPVFQTEFGTIAIQICYDWFFPEAEAIFAMRGAEILFAPTWGNTLPDEDGRVDGETTFRVRARDNGLYIVPSVYDGNSLIIDPMGRILVSSKGGQGVFWCEVDLNRREPLHFVGHWRSIGPRDRMPTTYGPLLAVPAKKE